MPDQFNLFESRIRRDSGIEIVLTGSELWKNNYKHIIGKWFSLLPVGYEFVGERLRAEALSNGIEHPHHHNCWGAAASGFIRGWLKENRIVVSGVGQTTSVRSHAHSVRVYKKLF